MNFNRITIKTSVLVAIATLLGSGISSALPAAAQTVAAKTSTQAYRNSLPPCATSSVDINICDLPFIRSQCGGGGVTPQYASPVAPTSSSPAENLVSSEYDQYLNAPTDSDMYFAMDESSFDNPSTSASSAPALQWTFNGMPCTSSSSFGCGQAISNFGCGQAISSFGCGTTPQAGCGTTQQSSMPACQTSCGPTTAPAACGVQWTWSSGGK